MVEEVAAMPVIAHCEGTQDFYTGQGGCRAGRSAVDAVGVAIAPYPGGVETRQSHGGPPYGNRGKGERPRNGQDLEKKPRNPPCGRTGQGWAVEE